MTKKFAKELLNRSDRFEPFRPANGIEALTMMNGLEDLARKSVQKEDQAKQKAKPVPPPPPAPKVTYKTDNPQYKAALKDEALIQALLELQKKSAPKRL